MNYLNFNNRDLAKTFHLALFIVCSHIGVFAQSNPPNPSVPSANLGPSVQSLQISNDLYNGKMAISIPLYNYEFEGISFPLALSYTGGNGIKPDEIPGWVGYGWNLQSGGYIHRTVRGKPDEARDFKTTIYTFFSCNGTPPSPAKKKTDLLSTDYSYLSNLAKLNPLNATWSSSSYANSLFTNTNISHYVETNCDAAETYNMFPAYDLVPDEFSVVIGDISGKFYLNHNNEWLFNSNDGKKYDVSLTVGEQLIVKRGGGVIHYRVPSLIKSITLTSSEGMRYFFGNTDPNAPIENLYWDHSRSSQLLGSFVRTTPLNVYSSANTYLDLAPHTWHLTKIENLKTGSQLNFDYKQQGLYYYKSRQMWGNGQQSVTRLIYSNSQAHYTDPTTLNTIYTLSPLSLVATRSWTPTEINFPSGVKIEFVTSASSQALTNETIGTGQFAGFYDNEELWAHPDYFEHPTLLKLDKIKVSYNNEVKKEIDFSYSNSYSNRLQLTSVKEVSGSRVANEYKFYYNNSNDAYGKLCPHSEAVTDHWGYYNNKSYFSMVSTPYAEFSKLTSSYSASREPDGVYGKAEILNKIVYPTGGAVEFEYEPNYYSKERNKGDFTISTVSGTGLETGGVRIKKVRYFTDANKLARLKEYEYTTPGTSQSSGVLVSPKPVYLIGSYNSWSFEAKGFSPAYYSGNHVNYTNVTEKETGNGKTVYQYTNYDNGFNDELPVSTNTNLLDNDYANKAFKRGKLVNIKQINEAGTTINQTDFLYEHDNSESNKEELRSLYLSDGGGVYSAISEKVYQDNLNSKEEKTYTPGGNISEKVKYTYDEYGNTTETITFNSNNQRNRQKYKYNYEYDLTGTDNSSLGINYLNDHGIKNAVIEKITYMENLDGSNSKIINGTVYIYKTQSPFVDKVFDLKISEPLTSSAFTLSRVDGNNFTMDSRYLGPEVQYGNYDTKGNILDLTLKNGIRQSYIWGYNNSLAIAVATNAQAKDIYYTSFEEIDGNSAVGDFKTGIKSKTNGFSKSLAGLTNGNYKLSYWQKSGAGWMSQSLSVSVTNGNYTINLTGQVDEVRFYPESAQMITYTHNPTIGITSMSDINTRIIYYEYDALGRLVVVRDQDKKVVKQICYNYAGQIENCALPEHQSSVYSEYIYRNNCTGNQIGLAYHVQLPAGQFVSNISVTDANTAAAAYAQELANQRAVCIDPLYGRLELGQSTSTHYIDDNSDHLNEEVELWIKFYSDAACTQPLTLASNLDFSGIAITCTDFLEGYNCTENFISGTALAGTTGFLINDLLPFYGHYKLFDENENLIYLERWKTVFWLYPDAPLYRVVPHNITYPPGY